MKYFGITETYDPAIDYSWVKNIKIGNCLITKNINNHFINIITDARIQCRSIVHDVCTGMGGTVLEPNVPTIEQSVIQTDKLLNKGFPIEQMVLRVSPIIPTTKGIDTAMKVIESFEHFGIKRIRYSTLNIYPHVVQRFHNLGIKLPYYTYSCPNYMRDEVTLTFMDYFNIKVANDLTNDTCAEIDLDEGLILKRACVSQKDLKILGIEDKIKFTGSGKQRRNCMCPDNKRQLFTDKYARCKHGCLYCYCKDKL